ncbi:MAG: peptidoglycan DD-metalloendopeptidase family protein [Eubacteriales bacterium]|nr:peptidoglycan DD-metalloendopeptidase family protein [Eubacteriales bacterium]
MFIALAGTVFALDTQSELDRLMAEQEELYAQWEEAQSALDKVENEQALADSDLAWLQERNEEQKKLYSEHMLQIAAITDMQQSLDRNLEVAIRQYEQRKANYEARMDSMYNLQKKSQLEILLESDSLSSYYTTLRFMKLISDADEQDLEHLRTSKEELQKQYEQTTAKLEQLQELLKTIENNMAEIQADVDAKELSLAAMDSEMAALYQRVESYSNDHFQLQINIDEATKRQEQEAYLNSLAAAQSEESPAGTGEPIYSGNGFIWPLANFDFISSEYGERFIPELGYPDFHTGLDFAADFDEPCLASAPGVVVFAGWYNEYAGNTVRIDAGSGIVIMYCHLNAVYATNGQSVSAGDVVGAVGSTGNSTGPHLHFQIEVGGNHVDPRLYLY